MQITLGNCSPFPKKARKDTLQRHIRVLTKFAHVEMQLSGRLRRRGVMFYKLVNTCDRRACSTSVAVGGGAGVRRLGAEAQPPGISSASSAAARGRIARGRRTFSTT